MLKECRACRSTALDHIYDLGPLYVSTFLKVGEDPGPKVPLTLVRCANCTLVQLTETVDPDLMYKGKYWYKSGTNESMRAALKDVVEYALTLVEPAEGGTWVDIGANDGTLLRFAPDTWDRVGFEPSPMFAVHDAGVCWIPQYFNAPAFDFASSEKANVISSIAMFYDLDDPNRFVEDIKNVLHPDGVWIVQMAYLGTMLETNDFSNICHEHLEYYDLTAFENLVESHGLKVMDVTLNDVNGGSFRLTVQHADKQRDKAQNGRVHWLREKERRGSTGADTFAKFSDRVERAKKRTMEYLWQSRKDGAVIGVLGASTKGNTLLQYYGLDNSLIAYASDRNPDKVGRFTVGTRIPINQEGNVRAPDIFLVLPWHFRAHFERNYKSYVEDGGRLLFPLPRPEIVAAKLVVASEAL